MATATVKNNSRTFNGARTSNGKTNGNGTAAKSKSTPPVPASNGNRRPALTLEEEVETLLDRVRTTILKKFGVKIQLREKRLQTKIGHAAKEKIGLDIAAQLKKRGKIMNWQRWNNDVFPALFGQPDALRYDIEVIAIVMAKIYDVFELEPQEAIKGLVKFNQESLAKRNSYNKANEADDDDDEDDDLEDEFDADEDEETEDPEEVLDDESEEDFDPDEEDDDSEEDEEEDLE